MNKLQVGLDVVITTTASQLCVLGWCLCRRVLQERVRQALSDPEVQSISLLARLRDEFGADSSTAVDNVVNLLFAGKAATH